MREEPWAYKKTCALVIALITLMSYTHSYAQQTVDDLIHSEFQAIQDLPQVPRVTLNIEHTPNGTSGDLPPTGVLNLNLPEEENLTKEIGAKYQRDIIRLILAHEMGHQIQYNLQSNRAGLVYECQADIIAGFTIYQLMFKEGSDYIRANGNHGYLDPGYQRIMQEQKDRFEASLTAIFKEGSDHELEPSHPTDDERRLAVRDGYNYGNIWTMTAFLSNPPPGYTDIQNVEMKLSLERFETQLDYIPGDNVVYWSKRQAQKIIHAFLPNCKNIVCYTQYTVDSSRLYAFIKYEQQITNTGKKILTFSYYNQIYSKKKSDPKNTLYWQLLVTDAKTITLAPNETQYINGRLEWLPNNDQSAEFVYPGKEGALYACSSLTDPPENVPDRMERYFKGGVSQSDEDMLDGFLSSRDRLEDFIGSVGKVKQPESAENPIYLCRVQLADARTTEIQYSNSTGQYQLNAQYDVDVQKPDAIHTITELIKALKDRNYVIQEHNLPDNNDRQWDIIDRHGVVAGAVYLNYSVAFQNYKTSLEVFGK